MRAGRRAAVVLRLECIYVYINNRFVSFLIICFMYFVNNFYYKWCEAVYCVYNILCMSLSYIILHFYHFQSCECDVMV